MALWLFKQEPDCYSFSDLERDGMTLWDGVTNALALKYLRQTQPGDQAFFYHTGEEKAVVGIMEITGPPQPDPLQNDPKLVVVPVVPKSRLKFPVRLAKIKADPLFADWELVRIARLSVMPVSESRWQRILEWSEKHESSGDSSITRKQPPRKK